MNQGFWRVGLAAVLTVSLALPGVGYAHDELSDEGKDNAIIGDYEWEVPPSLTTGKNFKHLKEVAAVSPKVLQEGENVTTADVYAHKGYAYLGTHQLFGKYNNGVRVFDIKDPKNPKEVAVFANDLPGTWQEKVIVKSVSTPYFKGDLAVVSVQQFDREKAETGGTVLYDVTDPTQPKKLGFWKLPKAVTGTHELALTEQGNRVLLLAANPNAAYYTHGKVQDFTIVDVTDPTRPETIFQWDPSEVAPDYREHNYLYFTDGDGVKRRVFNHSVIADETGKYAYLSFWDLGTVILDISDPENAKYLGRTSYERHVQGAAHSAALAKGGTVLIETREVFNPDPSDPEFERGFGYVRIYDIKDKANPKLISHFRTENAANKREKWPWYTVHDPKVRGNTLYLSHYMDGVRVVDITNPAAPVEVASYVPEDSFIWGVYVDRDYILASDIGSGLKVLQKNHAD